jgi:RsiW-degrading membrane proteinase PrsW (M82 family)
LTSDFFRSLLIQAGLSLLPVLAFLLALEMIDTFRLFRMRRVLLALAAGSAVAVVCYVLNTTIVVRGVASGELWTRFGAPLMEETAKAAYLYFLIRANRIGFMVDAAISGFAVGAGFAIVENVSYLPGIAGSGFVTAAIRGFGTAMMHGGATAIFGVVSINRAEISGNSRPVVFLPGLPLAVLIHLLYNQPLWPPAWNAAVLLALLPVLVSFVFWRSEKALEAWIGTTLDKDMDLLGMIASSTFHQSHAGRYLRSLESAFAPMVLGDLLCYLQLSLELRAEAKGALLRREMGFPVNLNPQLPARLRELAYLEQQIGRAGKLALAPLLGSSRREIWELEQLS